MADVGEILDLVNLAEQSSKKEDIADLRRRAAGTKAQAALTQRGVLPMKYSQGQMELAQAQKLEELANMSEEQVKEMALRAAHEEMRGQPGPVIAQQYQKRLQLLLEERRQYEELRQSGQAKIDAVAEAYEKGAAPAPGPVHPPPEEQGAMASGLPYQSPRLDYEEFRRETGIPIPPEAIYEAQRADVGKPPSPPTAGGPAYLRAAQQIFGRPRVGPPSKTGPSALGMMMRGLDKPSRLMVAGMTGALRALEQGSKDVKIEPTEFREAERMPGEKVKVSTITRTAGVPNEAFAQVFGDPELRKNMVNSVLEHVKGAWENRDPQSVYDLATFLKQAQHRYQKEAERQALKTLDLGELRKLDLATATQMVEITARGMYEDLIRQDVAGALGALDHELVSQMVAQFALDPLWFATPERIAKGAKGALKAAQKLPVVGEVPAALMRGGEALTSALLSKTEKVRWMGALWELDQAGTPGAAQLADLMRSASLRAPHEYQQFLSAADDYLKVVDKVAPEDTALFARVVDWGSYPKGERLSAADALATLPEKRAEKFSKALEAYQGWQMEHEWLRESTGIGNYWVGKGRPMGRGQPLAGQSLRPAAEAHIPKPWPVEGGGYVPRRQTADPAKQAAVVKAEREGAAAYAGRGRMTPGSAKARTTEKGAETASKWLQDVGEQAKYETHGPLGAAATSAAEMKLIKKFAGKVNLSKEGTNVRAGIMELPTKSLRRLQKEGKVEGVLSQLQRETGLTWTVMDEKTLVEPWMRVTGERAEGLGSRAYLMPTALKKRIDQLVPVVVAGGHDPSDAWKAIEAALKWTVRPVNLFGRWVTTIPNFMFAPRNAVGAEVLGYLAYGPGVLDPRAQKLAMEVAVGLAYGEKMPKFWLEGTTTLMNGQKIKRADLFRMAGEDMGQQLGARLTQYTDPLARTGVKRKLQAARDFPQKAAEFVGKHTLWGTPIPAPEALSSAKIAEISENFQHALGYVPALAGTDDLSRARALEKMGKFFGDYRRLSRIERSVLNEGIFFYSWVKFISGRGLSAIWENPKRVAHFQMLKQHFERAFGAQAGVPPEGLPEFYRGTAVTAPPGWQNPETRQRMAEARAQYEGVSVDKFLEKHNNGKAELPAIGSDAFVAMVMDEPLSMSLYWMDNLLGAVTGYGDQNFYDLAAPMTAAVIGTIVGIDPYGRKRPLGEVAKQHIQGLTTSSRPVATWKRAAQLYLEDTPEPTTEAGQLWRSVVQDLLNTGHLSEAAREAMRYQMVNDLPFMKPIMESATGKEYPEYPPVPGWIRTKRVEPQKAKDRAAVKAMEDVGLRAWELKNLEDR